MKKLFFLPLLALGIGLATPATAQSASKVKAKRAFAHNSEAGRGKTNKVQFRRESTRPVIDLHPKKTTSFKTVKAQKPYKFSNPH